MRSEPRDYRPRQTGQAPQAALIRESRTAELSSAACLLWADLLYCPAPHMDVIHCASHTLIRPLPLTS